MLAQVLTALIAALVFAAAAVGGTMIATAILPTLKRFDDGPPATEIHPMVLIVAAAVLGAVVGWKQAPPFVFASGALATVVLSAIWYCDSRTGIIPDWLTLVPLALLLVVGAVRHDWLMFLSAFAVFVPFALLAWLSKGVGMGWGDAKLAALGGALVGMEAAAFTFMAATLIALIVARIRNQPKGTPIALGPYLVCAIAVSIALEAG